MTESLQSHYNYKIQKYEEAGLQLIIQKTGKDGANVTWDGKTQWNNVSTF